MYTEATQQRDYSQTRVAVPQSTGVPTAGAPQLAMTADRLHHCVQELIGEIDLLEKRLDGVLNPYPGGKSLAEVASPRPVRCPLGEAMDSRSDEVYDLTCRVRMLLDRLAT